MTTAKSKSRITAAKNDPNTTVIGGIVENCSFTINPAVNKELAKAAIILAKAARENAQSIKSITGMLKEGSLNNACGIRMESPKEPTR